MRTLSLSISAISVLFGTSTFAQTNAESAFVAVAGTSVELPLSFAGALCGFTTEEVTARASSTTDPICTVDESTATSVGLMDEDGEMMDLTRQGFATVTMPDTETLVQLPINIAAQLCELEASELAGATTAGDQASSCNLTQEDVDTTSFPGLRLARNDG